jgi:regulatory protein YycH of two-component signal transduction system YycFG
MTDNSKRIRLNSDSSDDENQENKRPRIEQEEKIEEYEYVEVTGERMEQILKEETAKGATIESFDFIMKNGSWTGNSDVTEIAKRRTCLFRPDKEKIRETEKQRFGWTKGNRETDFSDM